MAGSILPVVFVDEESSFEPSRHQRIRGSLLNRQLVVSTDEAEPKHKIFEQGVFTQIRHVQVDDLGFRPKNSRNYGWGHRFEFPSGNFFYAVGWYANKKF